MVRSSRVAAKRTGSRPRMLSQIALLLALAAPQGVAFAQEGATPPAPSTPAQPAEPATPAPAPAQPLEPAAPPAAPARTAGSAPPPASPLPPRAPSETVTEVDPIDIPPDHDPLAHAWDRPGDRGGFYLRASTTLGVHNTRLGAAPWEREDGRHARGFGSGFGLDIGAFLTPWLALHVDASAGVLWNGHLNYELDNSDAPSERARVLALGVAPAVTFFTPHAFFIKGAFGVGYARVKQPGPDNSTDPGFYMNFVAGKDLYVDRNFALGLQFQIAYMLLGDEQPEDEARIRQFLFGFSAAFDSI
jgi:hypothetical protein